MPSQWALPTPTPLSVASHLSWLTVGPWVTHDVIIDIVTPALWRHPHIMSVKGSCLILQPTPCMEPALLVRRVEVGLPTSPHCSLYTTWTLPDLRLVETVSFLGRNDPQTPWSVLCWAEEMSRGAALVSSSFWHWLDSGR